MNVLSDLTQAAIAKDFGIATLQMRRPFVLLRPKMFPDGNKWCALYGDNIHDGVAAFGDTPDAAALQFYIEWKNAKADRVTTTKAAPSDLL